MKMSLLPWPIERSRSWCTSWKSRVASAVDTTSVGVIGSSQTGMSEGGSGSGSGTCVPAGRHFASVTSSSIGSNQTSTASPIATSPLTSPIIRTPSSRSTSAKVSGSCLPGTAGAWWTRNECTVPRPDATTYPRSIAWHDRAHRAGRVPQLAARVARLDAQLAGRRAGPEEFRVAVDHRPRRLRLVDRGPTGAGLELEDAERHRRDLLVADGPDALRRDEPALADAGLLGADDIREVRADARHLPGSQRAGVRLVAVGAEHRRCSRRRRRCSWCRAAGRRACARG